MTPGSEGIGENVLTWLQAQRWFGDKSRTITAHRVMPIATVALDAETITIAAVTVEFDGGGSSTYLLTLSGVEPPTDATGSSAFLGWLASGLHDNRELTETDLPGATIRWESMPGADLAWVSTPGRLLSGEQSNSSIIYGDRAILKLFRKLQTGINPDSEIVAFLTGQTGYRHVPTYLGGITLTFDDGRPPIELAAVQGFVENQGDCWRWLPGALLAGSPAEQESLLDQVTLLGQRTGELHAALATGGDLPAFSPEVFDSEEAKATIDRVRREVRSTIDALQSTSALNGAEASTLGRALERRITGVSLEGLPRIRVHGDYHLGQVLRTKDDFVIIDFEGEPSRSMAERREKHSPFKDVAGMLRSLDYAVSSASHDAARESVDQLLDWGRRAEDRFLDGYREAVSTAPIVLVPGDADQFGQALDLFMIDKAVYEVRYELDNRPDWLHIPLDGLRRIAAAT